MNVAFDPSELQPVIDQAVETALQRVGVQQADFGDRIALTEAEAAQALGVRQHVLRDLRLQGKINASRVGRRIVYECTEILDYLRRNRVSDYRSSAPHGRRRQPVCPLLR